MKKNVELRYVRWGVEVWFRVLRKVGGKWIFEWEFGDDKGEVLNGGRDEC